MDETEGYPFFTRLVNSPRHLVQMGFIILGISTVLFKIFERVSFLNAMYWSIITSLGVGYGDVTPHHVGGKILAGALAITTLLFFIPMIVASITSRMVVDRNAFTNAEQEEMKHDLRKVLTKLGIPHDTEEEQESGA